MKSASLASLRRRMLVVITTTLMLGSSALAEKIIHRFNNNSDGLEPFAGLVLHHGKFYGTTAGGGQFGLGTVFELDPPQVPGGAWTEVVLYSFTSSEDAHSPTTGIVFDKQGNLYGCPKSLLIGVLPFDLLPDVAEQRSNMNQVVRDISALPPPHQLDEIEVVTQTPDVTVGRPFRYVVQFGDPIVPVEVLVRIDLDSVRV